MGGERGWGGERDWVNIVVCILSVVLMYCGFVSAESNQSIDSPILSS